MRKGSSSQNGPRDEVISDSVRSSRCDCRRLWLCYLRSFSNKFFSDNAASCGTYDILFECYHFLNCMSVSCPSVNTLFVSMKNACLSALFCCNLFLTAKRFVVSHAVNPAAPSKLIVRNKHKQLELYIPIELVLSRAYPTKIVFFFFLNVGQFFLNVLGKIHVAWNTKYSGKRR